MVTRAAQRGAAFGVELRRELGRRRGPRSAAQPSASSCDRNSDAPQGAMRDRERPISKMLHKSGNTFLLRAAQAAAARTKRDAGR